VTEQFDYAPNSGKNDEIRSMKGVFAQHLRSTTRLAAVLVLVAAFGVAALAQEVVDKTVATVSDGVRTELITYSDLLWQLALQPNESLTKPSSESLNQALAVLVNLRLFALEAERIPREPPTEAEINAKIAETLTYFPSTAEFERRLNLVGFSSVKDDNFERIIAQRVAIDKYLDFRFRSFVVITAEDEAKYYREVYTPEFERKYAKSLIPTLDSMRPEINRTLTEQKLATQIEAFLDEAKRRARIVYLATV
jgi:hypothetical protein